MSEELIQKGLDKSGIKIGNYEYYNIGSTTLSQLKNYKIIPDKDYESYSLRKPDGLLVDRQNKSAIQILVVLEHKQPSEFKTNKQKVEAIRQCNDVCQTIYSKIGIITDGQATFWINPHHADPKNEYLDKTTNKKRSYSFIRNEDKKDLSEPFALQNTSQPLKEKLDDDTKNTLEYIDRIQSCINDKNSTLIPTEEVDPLGLACNVWQNIYINTGKEPQKCLYNVVELFIFKFLSDLGVLKSPYDFTSLINMYENKNSNKDVLSFYARNSRPEIINLFPKGDDGTSIINGTIFVDTNGNPEYSQANLFRSSLREYRDFGSLKNIKKEFKTKLFETFLKQSHRKSRLGQFFTPRKVVRAIVEMADVENLPDNSTICDPFCGVGGFLVEPLHKTRIKNSYIPVNGKIRSKIKLLGFDRGMDEDEERTIILAKANMLIYLSEIIEKYPTLTKEFSRIFNETFHIISDSNLGTLSRKFEENEKIDLILTNPPYITEGMTSIRDEIRSEGLDNYFTFGSKGVEGLALEWIIKNLKHGNGRAFIIIPDSILHVEQNKGLRESLLKECFLNCIISLPVKTFFNTPKKTYILGITKKGYDEVRQDFPVFTYIVSNIGEQLDATRFEIEGKSDLEKAKDLFNSYKGSPKTFPIDDIGDLRCKLQPIERFEASHNWTIDKWWTKEEKIDLGIEEESEILSIENFSERLEEFDFGLKEKIALLKSLIGEVKADFKEEKIGELFDFPKTNAKITRKFCIQNEGTIPVYASSKDEVSTLGYIKDNLKNIKYYENCLSYNRNGSVGYVFVRNHRFTTNEDHRTMSIKDEYKDKLFMDYLKYEIEKNLFLNGFNYLDKCGVSKIKKVSIQIPIDENGEFDYDTQKEIANKIKLINKLRKEIKEKMGEIVDLPVSIY